MKTAEFQIGDWVMCNTSTHPQRIRGILDDKIKIGSDWLSVTEISPIPLASEILEDNGFLDIDSLGEEKCNGHNIYYKINGGGYGINELGLRLYFVHELQHALKLCGFTALADILKIKSTHVN